MIRWWAARKSSRARLEGREGREERKREEEGEEEEKEEEEKEEKETRGGERGGSYNINEVAIHSSLLR